MTVEGLELVVVANDEQGVRESGRWVQEALMHNP